MWLTFFIKSLFMQRSLQCGSVAKLTLRYCYKSYGLRALSLNSYYSPLVCLIRHKLQAQSY